MQTIKLTGLTCGACQKLITKRIMKIEGVNQVRVELNGKTEIEAERNIEKSEIQKVLEGTQYKVV
jgi:copper chaperone CopZ